MKYGQIVEDTRRNEEIYHYLGYISERDQKKIVRKLKQQSHDEIQVKNIIRELQLGAYLCSNGFMVEYDRRIGSKTPDWCILDESKSIRCIIELISHHLNRKSMDYIESKRRDGKTVIGYRPDENDPDHIRLYQDLEYKATIYKELIDEAKNPYVIAVYCDSYAVVDIGDLTKLLFEGESAIFTRYPRVSGVMCVGGINFTYIINPNPTARIIALPSGIF